MVVFHHPAPERVLDHLHSEGVLARDHRARRPAPRHPPRRGRRRPRAGRQRPWPPLPSPASSGEDREPGPERARTRTRRRIPPTVPTGGDTRVHRPRGAAGRRGQEPPHPHVQGGHDRRAHAPGTRLHRPRLHRHRPAHPGGPQPRHLVPARPAGGDRVPLHPPRRPGHRALRRGQLLQEPRLFRPRQPGGAGVGGGVLGHRHHPGRPGRRGPALRHRIPFIVKLNHNEFLHYPSQYDQVMFGSARQAADLGAIGVGATIYFGQSKSDRQIQEVRAFAEAHELGMFTVLWCYLRNAAFKTKEARLPRRGRSHRPGQPHRRHPRGRPHQAEAAGEQRRLHGRSSSARPTPSSTST